MPKRLYGEEVKKKKRCQHCMQTQTRETILIIVFVTTAVGNTKSTFSHKHFVNKGEF